MVEKKAFNESSSPNLIFKDVFGFRKIALYLASKIDLEI